MGRVLKGDLISLMGANPKPSERKIQYGEEERIKMTRLRQTIAKRLKQAQENAALLTTFNEVDMSMYGNEKRKSRGFSISIWDKIRIYVFLCKSMCSCFKKFPSSKCRN
jgi:2-oxoglutarate dehydrogenase E2 component (dihydrolipoamide succinyltransferase)